MILILPRKTGYLFTPQATKYIATQQDPFSTQFDLFRKALHSKTSNVLIACGYSLGGMNILIMKLNSPCPKSPAKQS